MKGRLFALYRRMPVWIQNVLMSLYGAFLGVQRYGAYYQRALRSLQRLDKTDERLLRNIQNRRFLELLSYAAENSEFYKNLYKDVPLDKVRSVKDISMLPMVEKEDLRQNVEKAYTIKKRNAIVSHTGGTTGKSLEVYYTKKDMQERMAYLHEWEMSHGVKRRDKRASFNGREFISRDQEGKVFWRYNFIRRQMLYSTFDMTEENLPYYVKSLNSFKPAVINGFVSAIYEVASFIVKNGIRLSFRPKVVFTTSETLLPHHREMISQAFSCPVRDQYASSEGAPFITECECGRLHYNITTGVIEEYHTDMGTEMLVTSFQSHGTPLIRYRIGDLWELGGGRSVSLREQASRC